MANHMWVCPTKNHDEFYDINKLLNLLEGEFPEFIFYIEPNNDGYGDFDNYLGVHSKADEYLFSMMCYDSCRMFDKMDVVEWLDQKNKFDLSDKLIDVVENGKLNVDKCIEIRHTPYSNEINMVTKWMRWYFAAFLFDEGIHPDFCEPISIKPSKEKDFTFLKTFKKWLKS